MTELQLSLFDLPAVDILEYQRAQEIRVLIGCESSNTVCSAFARLGFDAWSCDLLPNEQRSNKHLQCDIRDVLDDGWDFIMVAHPPCTYLCNSGVQWLSRPTKHGTVEQRWEGLHEGCELFADCLTADIPRIAVENPVMHGHAKSIIAKRIPDFDKATQTIQPWWFGDPAFKATGLYLRGLPCLLPTDKLTPPAKGTDEHKAWSAIHRAAPSPDRWKLRSKTFEGIARAMANQWGNELLQAAA